MSEIQSQNLLDKFSYYEMHEIWLITLRYIFFKSLIDYMMNETQ